jgi:hypothetical protein
MPDQTLPLRLVRQCLLQSSRGTQIDIDDRQVIEVTAMSFRSRIILGGVHQVI